MERAAIGIRAHSGWAALVVVAGIPGAIDVIDRKKVVVTGTDLRGAKQPYHHVKGLSLPDAERYLAHCAAASEKLALGALGETIQKLRHREKSVENCAILLAAGRDLPSLEKILASHALIHTAEGEFFRQCFRGAAEQLNLRVSGIREMDLDAAARGALGAKANTVRREIDGLRRRLGPPWTSDQKNACLAALMSLME